MFSCATGGERIARHGSRADRPYLDLASAARLERARSPDLRLPLRGHQQQALRKQGGGQAKKSQHILGKAADITFPDVAVKTLRNSALVQEWGGVGYYPTSGVPFVHVDTGHVRMWPRIPRLELASLFPKGQTKYLPLDGKPITPKTTSSLWPRACVKTQHDGRGLQACAETGSRPSVSASRLYASSLRPMSRSRRGRSSPPIRQRRRSPLLRSRARRQRRRAAPERSVSFMPVPAAIRRARSHTQARQVPALSERRSRRRAGSRRRPSRGAELRSLRGREPDDRRLDHLQPLVPADPPEQKDISYLFEDMDRPLALDFRPSSGYQGLAAAQSFSGKP